MKFKKLLCCVLALAMVLGTMGITTFAEGEVETISVSTAENLATALTKNEANIAVILEDNIDLPITSLGSITAGSGEYKLGGENTQEITIDLNQKTLNVTTTYWSALGSVNPDATITVKNGTMVSTGNSATTWNANDLRFCNCNWVFEDVTFNKEVALDNAGKLTTMNDVTINGTGDYYALWITAEGQTVNIDGLVINTEGRGIKIDEQYVDAENTVQVALAVSNSTFKTAKKAAIVVKSVAGADISTENVDISNVVADSTNLVWVDEDSNEYYNKVQVSGGTVAAEGVDTAPIEVASKDELNKAISDAKNGQTIKLTANIEADQIIIEKAVTLDLGGNALTTTSGWGGLLLKGGASLVNGNLSHTGNTAAIKLWDAREISDVTITVAFTEGKTKGGIVIQSDSVGVDVIKNVTISGDGLTNGIETYNCGKAAELVIGSMNKVTIDAVGTAMNISAPCGTATDCTFSGDVTGIELWIKGTYSATLELVDCDVAGGSKAVYVHDEFNSNPDIENIGTLSLTVDEETTFESENGSVFTMTIARAENVNIDEQLLAYAVAENGKSKYSSFADALADAKDGDTISLIYNEGDAPIAMNGALYGNKTVSITGDAVVDWSKGWLFVGRGGEGNGKLIFDNANLTSTEASLKNGTYGIHVSMEEYGASNKADGEVVFKNSNIDLSYLMNKNNVTVDGGNLTVWYGFAVGARPASETNNVQRAAELKLSNNAVVEVKNHNGMGIGYESNGIANIDAGSTLKISAASLAVAANSTVNSKGNIIGLLDVADGATMNFTDGFYTEDPSAYCAEGYEVDKSEVEGYAYTVVPKAAQKINVVFENGKNEGEYILKLKSADEKEIYEFVSAELTFKNNSESLGDAIGTLPFEFVENTNIDVEKSLEDANTYAFALKNPANRITATEIELGTIKFTSQGTPALAVTAGTVVATRYNTNLPKYYSTDAELNGEGLTLDISATLDGTPVPDTTRDVAVKIEYNLGLVGGVWADDEIEVTLVDKFGDEVTATKVSNGLFTFEDVATGRIEVKLSAPGFRTYTYDAILYETEEENNPLVLNFWNNVKTGEDEDPLKKIDDSNAIEKEMAHNFVVGDIVMDFIVDRYDLAAVTSYYGMYNITERTNASEKYLKYDLNRDGNIDIIDVHYVLHTFGN